MAVAAVIGVATVVGAAVSMSNASKAEKAAQRRYNAQFSADQQAQFANAEAGLRQAEIQAGAILAGARANARSSIGQAEAKSKAILAGAASEAAAAETAANLARDEAFANVMLMKKEADESLRRLNNEQNVYEQKAKAKAAAQGGRYSGSISEHMRVMDEEDARQYGYLKGAYTNQQRVARENANRKYQASMAYRDAALQGAAAEAQAQREAGNYIAHAYIEGAGAEAGAVTGVARANYNAVNAAYAPQQASPYTGWAGVAMGGNPLKAKNKYGKGTNGRYPMPGVPGHNTQGSSRYGVARDFFGYSGGG